MSHKVPFSKKAIIQILMCGLAYTLNAVEAFELPSQLENNIIDHIIHWGENTRNHFKQIFKQEGISNLLITAGYRKVIRRKTDYARVIAIGGLQFATPLMKKMSNRYSLYRFEFNALGIHDDFSESHSPRYESLKNFWLVKCGLSGRNIINPNFIVGCYGFYDQFFKAEPLSSTSWMTNLGFESMWPRHGGAIAVDFIFNPINLMQDSDEHFYKVSFKASILKPKIFDMYLGASITKSAYYLPEILPCFGLKFRIPIKTWNINKRFTVGIKGVYKKRPDTSLISLKNIAGGSIYIQFNLLKDNPQYSLRDYLRMPIDRFVGYSWHPDQGPDKKRRSNPSTPLEQSGVFWVTDENAPTGPIDMEDRSMRALSPYPASSSQKTPQITNA